MVIDIAVCDDDNNDLNSIITIIKDIVNASGKKINIKSFTSAKELLEDVEHIDIAVLDISMDELNGIELGRKLKIRFPELKLVYITSYKEYCMQAINKVHAYSFLAKPIDEEEMQVQMEELINEFEKLQDFKTKIFYNVVDSSGKESNHIELKLRDIIYFEYVKSKRRISIILENEIYEYSYVMEKLIEELKGENFEVSCRGTLVNLCHTVKIKGYDVYMDNGKILALSQKRVSRFKEAMNDFIHKNV